VENGGNCMAKFKLFSFYNLNTKCRKLCWRIMLRQEDIKTHFEEIHYNDMNGIEITSRVHG
jgi:hypothetical protein